MSVHRRSYQRYTGPLTPAWSRVQVLGRFAALELVETRRLMAYLVLCLVPCVAFGAFIYIAHTPTVQALLGLSGPVIQMFKIDSLFFLRCVSVQGFFAFVLATWVGPGLVAPDLANGALPLFLSRPLSRFEYVAGKMAVLAGLLSLITWVPNILLFALQAALEEGWLGANLRIGVAILLGSGIWVVVLSLIALALSAWVKRRITASMIMFGSVFFGRAISQAWLGVLENPWGRVADLRYLIDVVWNDLFGFALTRPPGAPALHGPTADLPVSAAWASLLTISAACLWLLDRRVRAKEIAR
jgi:ABC-2 type transport system permease protein